MTELLREHDGINCKSLLGFQILGPVDLLDFFIDIIRTLCLEVADGFEDTDGGVKLEVRPIHHFLVTGE